MNGVILRFRVMAIWAGVMSLLLWFAYMPAKYLVSDGTFYERFIGSQLCMALPTRSIYWQRYTFVLPSENL